VVIAGAVDLAGGERSAILSPCKRYRYELRRVWDGVKPRLYVGGLNPSKADAEVDDLTVTKLCGFASRLGLGGIVVWNLYAYRATDPRDLWRAELERVDIVGPNNARYLERIFDEVAGDRGARLVAAWGEHRNAERVEAVLDLMDWHRGCLERLECWGTTKAGAPRHPSRIAYATPLVRWPVPV
jgi:hypothetical protein